MGAPPSFSRISTDSLSGDWGNDSEAVASTLNRFMSDSSSLFSGQLRLSNLGCMVWTARIVTPSDLSVGGLSFTNSWNNFGASFQTAGFWKDAAGIVHLQGLIKSGTLGLSAFVLPPGYRPTATEMFPANSNGGIGRLDVQADGQVIPQTGSNLWYSLSGASYRTSDSAPYNAACFPISKQSTLPNQLANDVRMGLLMDMTPGTTPISVASGGCAWRNSNGNIVIDNIPGLLPGRVYAAVFIAYPAK